MAAIVSVYIAVMRVFGVMQGVDQLPEMEGADH
jgi:hypothetical protein